MSATLGRDIETERDLIIGDNERRSGLYILGKPRMGKSWLIVNLIMQDIENGHGIFFLDPHGQAIEDIRDRYSYIDRDNGLRTPYLLFDPEDPVKSFGINPLRCCDVDHITDRNEAFARTKAVFDKLWKNSFEEKPWLQLVLQNTIYAFIENQGFTIAEFPMFFSDPAFRNFIVGNMRYNETVKNYWQKTFVSQSKHDQDEEIRAARTRLNIMLGNDFVNHILSQNDNVLDFKELIDDKRVILLKLSVFLSHESKKIIGTIVVNELLHAIRKRETNDQFCIFVDEFQTFAAYDDFTTLITDAPKFGIATTIAHHERYGQLLEEPKILGATAAIANKILFQATARDAEEFAPEFAEKPPFVTRFEDIYVLSRNPVWDMLYGHDNPDVCKFIEKYLRPIKERLEDILGEERTESLMRMEYLDEANLLRLDERLEAVNIRTADSSARRGLLYAAGQSIQTARMQTDKLQMLNEEAQMLRRLIRSLNKSFIAVMDGTISPFSESFKTIILEQMKYMDLVDVLEPVFQIHLLLRYGEHYHNDIVNAKNPDPRKRTGNHYSWCKDHPGIFSEPTTAMEQALTRFNTDMRINDMEQIIEITKNYCLTSFQRYGKPVPLDRFPYLERWQALEQNLNSFIAPLRDLKTACILLQRPENHLKTKSKQVIERQVPMRTEADMAGEVVRKITELPKYTAYAKILQNRDVWKGKIDMLKIGPVTKTKEKINMSTYCYQRDLIELLTQIRQESWKAEDEPPPSHS